ncbi:hypothetical protein J6590_009310 [Homalodisca vitripennis]|nr:hypothetical protein J6590_009310 [Homalodisca vitripennis]
MANSCPVCIKSVLDSEEGIGCDGACMRWFHRECIKMSKSEYQRISGNNNVKWYCLRTDCLQSSNQPFNLLLNQLTVLTDKISDLSVKVDSLTSLPAKVDNLIAEVDRLNKNLSHLEQRVNLNEAGLKTLENKFENISKHPVNPDLIMPELNERSSRSKNIMIFNLPESDDKNVETRKAHDLLVVNKLLNHFLPTYNCPSTKVLRVGKKYPNKPRPLKVILDNGLSSIGFITNFSRESPTKIDQ